MNFFVVLSVTNVMPMQRIDIMQLRIPQNILLDDLDFYKPGEIDLLIRAKMFFSIIQNNTKYLMP